MHSSENRHESQHPALQLYLISGLVLFLELSLIRWSGSNIVHLSYFSNFILLGSFLGIGVGFLLRQRKSLFPLAVFILFFFVAVIHFFPVQINRDSSTLLFFTGVNDQLTGLPIWATLPYIFLCVAAVFAALSQTMAAKFSQLPSLTAYRVDLVGSLTGIAVFSALSFIGWPPIAWGILAAVGLYVVAPSRFRRLLVTPLIGLVLLLGLESLSSNTYWSPYYKITTYTSHVAEINQDVTSFLVNGIPHQQITPLALMKKGDSFYQTPFTYRDRQQLDDVLIIGAGTGSDVAAALDAGAKHVDAVEIDPVLARLGRQRNPDRPYDDPRVVLHINDGRSFLEQTKQQYDLIIFALPDSLTLVSGQSSLRLESYMFTVQSFQAVAKRLKTNGVFSMYNFYRETWLVDRLQATIERVFQHAPCVDTIEHSNVFVTLTVAKTSDGIHCHQRWTAHEPSIQPATDTYPFLYLHRRSIPSFYVWAIGLILIVSLGAIRLAGGTMQRLVPYADLFWMGAAFMLLETKNIVHFALLFGTTWFVNALVFGGILLVIFLTVTWAQRLRLQRFWPWYLALFASLGIAWIVPEAWLLHYAAVPRFLIATVIAFLPIFLANCIFAARLRASDSSTDAFAANLIGAMFGGVLEYSSLIIGYQSLLIVVAILYALALWSIPQIKSSLGSR